MRLFATLVAVISLLGSGNTLAQSAGPPASNATQIAEPQDWQTIKIMRSGSQLAALLSGYFRAFYWLRPY